MAMAKRTKTGDFFLNRTTYSFIDEIKQVFEVPDLVEKISDEQNKSKKLHSPKFLLCGVQWSVRVVPDCKNSGFIGVYLHNHTNQDQTFSATFKGSAGAVSGWDRKVVKAKQDSGCQKFLSHDDYKTYAEENGDVFQLEVSVSMRSKDLDAADIDGWTRTRIKCGQTIMDDISTSDFIIRCNDKAFRVHKTIFCARSPVFRASMLSGMEEGRKDEMVIPDIDEETLATLIKYVYTDKLEMTENQDLQKMINAAVNYDLPGLVTLICDQMREKDLKGEKIADLLISAYKHGKKELKELAVERIKANRLICQEEGFKQRMEAVHGAAATMWIDLLKDL